MELAPVETVDYLIIGHIAIDLAEEGQRLGGTTTYSAVVAQALGLRVGVVTSWAEEVEPGPLQTISIANFPTEKSTTFENKYTTNGRRQRVYHVAPRLDYYQVPDSWRRAPIVHLAPIAQEVESSIIRNFSDALIGITPQGWMRSWTPDGDIIFSEWPESRFVLERCSAAVISLEDVGGDERYIEEMSASCKVLVVTEGAEGVRLYWNGDVRRYRAPKVSVVDTTGAGDVFAASFFTRLYFTRDPWEAARFATHLASHFVSRPGWDGIPTPDELKKLLIEVY